MLKILRKKGVMKKILWFVAVIIILSFGFFGQAYLLGGNRPKKSAGKIFGQKISIDKYIAQLAHIERQARIQHGDQFNRIAEYLNLGGQAWDRLILLHEANKKNIKVTDQEVVDLIKLFPFFQKDGVFDNAIYKRILQYGFRIKERGFEENTRNSLKISKLFEEETANVSITEEEVFNTYKTANEKVQVSYILFADENYKDKVEYDEIQTKNYYLANKKDFLIPPMVNVEYIKFEFPEESTPLEDQSSDVVDEEPPTPETSSPSESAANDTEAAKDHALEKIQNIAEELSQNPDFAQAAAKHGAQVETSGFFSMEQPLLKTGWTYPILQNIFQADSDIIMGPFETLKGYQIIKVIEKKDASIPDYPEAKDKVKEAWMANEAKVFSEKDAKENLEIISEKFAQVKRPDFAKTAKDINLEISQTPVFNRGQYLPQIGISRDFQETAFALTLGNPLSDVVETTKGYCLLYLDEIISVDMEEYERKKDEFTQKLLQEKQNAAFNDFLTLLRLKANLEDNITRREDPAVQ
ncbi:MAG: SurA N-terminal domain-containing protein [Candidatus Omnitrophica bacterium]|nr:SurA N-terminal domain-containing protein [Candidatus Omnitrophota bacterium]